MSGTKHNFTASFEALSDHRWLGAVQLGSSSFPPGRGRVVDAGINPVMIEGNIVSGHLR